MLIARRSVPNWVQRPLWRRARRRPTLDLDFAGTKSLRNWDGSELVTFTRASDATFVGADGLIQTATTNVPRFTHNPLTGECLGLLVEEARTNSIRNAQAAGAVTGTPGTLPTNWTGSEASGITRQIIGTGTFGAATYIDIKYSGTPTSTGVAFQIQFDANAAIAASPSQAWSASCIISLAGGSFDGFSSAFLRVVERGAGGSYIAETPTSYTPSSAAQTVTATRSSMGASTQFVSSGIYWNGTSGVPVDVTIRLLALQLELGSFPTSYIPTTSAAVTRAADVATITSGVAASNIRTLYAEFASPASGTRGVVSLNDNTANERLGLQTSGTDPLAVCVDGGVTQASIDAGTIAANTRVRMAARFAPNSFAASVNGGAVVTDASGTLPTVDRLFIGRTQAGEYLNGPIARLVGWTDELSDSVLQELTRA